MNHKVTDKHHEKIQICSPVAHNHLVSFDAGVTADVLLQQPDRYRYWDSSPDSLPVIPRGAGLSYAGASFIESGLTVSHASFDRVIGFDSATNTVEVEAGITLFAVHKFLSERGLYLPVQPGHGCITIGGCIAADVHGKNHARDGTFMNQVASLVLFHPSHGMLELSRENEPELFRLTCGGYGLTGHIIRARLRASNLTSKVIKLKAVQISSAIDGMQQLKEMARKSDFAYSWHDMGSTGNKFGSGYVFHADFVTEGDEALLQFADLESPNLTAAQRAAWPIRFLNTFSVRAMNIIYRYQQRPAMVGKYMSLQEALFPIHKAQLYFKLFGAKGFHEYQVILPLEVMYDYLDSIRKYLRDHPLTITLASAKSFYGSPELLRFTGEGICLALNIIRSKRSQAFMHFLDQRVIALGGVPNIIKDSRLPRDVVDACYLGADEFRMGLLGFDPKRMFRSELSERLGL